jgi:hypothetical protein
VELDADEPAVVEAEACAVAVAERRAPRLVVGVRQAGHQPWLDPAAVATTRAAAPSGTASTTLVQVRWWAWATVASPPPRLSSWA